MNQKKVSFSKQKEEYARSLSIFPPDIQRELEPIIDRNNFNGVIPVEKAQLIIDSLGQSIEELMLDLLPLASLYSCPVP